MRQNRRQLSAGNSKESQPPARVATCGELSISRPAKFSERDSPLLIFDRAVSALVEDLHERGLADDCTVVAWGEFGRTPKINKDAGRDHWPRVLCALLAGGGMKTGQTIGTTDRLGGEPETRSVTFEEIHATLYHNLGINLASAPRLFDFRGRPQYLVDPDVKPMKELV